ncbi:MAG TPA: hypothetical protein VNE21_04975 [Mycobacteriales bacterium]|nr:hypothetical protein [Mycobacteriales bacterium]
MITDLEVRGYRSFEHAHAPLGLVTLVTGDTGSGKTGLLDALGFLATCALGGLAAAVEERGGFAAVAHRGARGPVRRAGITVTFTLPEGTTGSYGFVVAPLPDERIGVLLERCVLEEPDGRTLRFDRLGEVPTAQGFLVPEIEAERDQLSITHMGNLPPVEGLHQLLAGFTLLPPQVGPPDGSRAVANGDAPEAVSVLAVDEPEATFGDDGWNIVSGLLVRPGARPQVLLASRQPPAVTVLPLAETRHLALSINGGTTSVEDRGPLR